MWRVRLRTLEAMVLVSIARMLIRFVPLRIWRRMLGHPLGREVTPAWKPTDNAENRVRSCVAAVNRASYRLPGTICLPQAIALQWMLARRGIVSVIALGFLPNAKRGSVDDLHAWVEWNERIAIGESGGKHATLLRFISFF